MPVTNFAILDIGAPELLIILAVILLLFGGKKLPELSRSIGTSLKELRSGASEIKGDDSSPKKKPVA
jgi:sec-independent protein translocase protein TatA